jgi:hypothetical protein
LKGIYDDLPYYGEGIYRVLWKYISGERIAIARTREADYGDHVQAAVRRMSDFLLFPTPQFSVFYPCVSQGYVHRDETSLKPASVFGKG